jgi:hypothetical protein
MSKSTYMKGEATLNGSKESKQNRTDTISVILNLNPYK